MICRTKLEDADPARLQVSVDAVAKSRGMGLHGAGETFRVIKSDGTLHAEGTLAHVARKVGIARDVDIRG